MKRPAKKFALGALAVITIWILFEHLLGFNTTRHDIGQYTRMFPMFFFLAMIFVAIYYRRRGLGNTLRFAEGFKTGIVMTLIFCAGFTTVIILYQQFLNPEYFSTLHEFCKNKFAAEGLAPEEIDKKLSQLERWQGSSAISYLLLFVFSSIWGIIVSAIASLILMRKPKSA